MANTITSVFAIALIMGAVLILTSASISSADRVLPAWVQMAETKMDQARSSIDVVEADIVGSGEYIDISVRNTGQTNFRYFQDWDVVIQYYTTSSNQGFVIQRVLYSTSTPPGVGEWTVEGLYINTASSTPEVYDPDVLNPGEEMVLRMNVTPEIPADTDNLVVIAEPGGVTLTAPFSR